jgi:hypothetical protein
MFSIPPEIWGIISIVLAVVSLAPYLWSTIKGKTKPHIFTWIIWTLLTAIAFLLQYTEGAGAGAWSGLVSTLFCIAVLIASIKYGEKHITRSDWIVFLAALAAIPIWLLTKNAALAAVWVTAIDAAGFIPTMRKSWIKPYEEMVTTHGLSLFKHITVLFAVQDVHFATIFYSWGMLVMNGVLVALILIRRRIISNNS